MKKRIICLLAALLLLLGLSVSASAAVYANVIDTAELLSESEAEALDARCSELEQTYGCGVYLVTVDSLSDRVAVLSRFGCRAGEDPRRVDFTHVPEEEAAAFLSGAFLACGAVSDPEKGYRVEFATQHQPLADDLAALLAEYLAPPKRTVRRNDYLLYYKESENIEDLLTYLGAPKSSLELMEVKIVKELRNRVNRATNCETANISKTVNAALSQIEDIRLIEASGGIGSLDEELRELARLRLQNPDMSLRELGQALTSPISRSGVNHRLRRISEYAAELRRKEHREEQA